MAEIQEPLDAEVVHEIPDDLALLIGRVMVTFAKLEHKLTMLSGLLLQLNKAEVRIALRTPCAAERLEMILDLFSIKDIHPSIDVDRLSSAVVAAKSNRDLLAHSLWLKHPKTGELYVRMTHGSWPRNLTLGEKVTRAVYPQSIPCTTDDCRLALRQVEETLVQVDALGMELDLALDRFPGRFRPTAPILNPLGRRSPRAKQQCQKFLTSCPTNPTWLPSHMGASNDIQGTDGGHSARQRSDRGRLGLVAGGRQS